MKRFALAAVAALALSLVAGERAQSAQVPSDAGMKKLGWKLACQAWTFRELTAFETLEMLQRLGIRYVEFFPGQRFSKEKPEAKLDHNMSPELMSELKAKLKSCKVTAVNYGVVDVGRDEASARKVFDWAKQMGIKTVVSEPAEEMAPVLDRLCGEYKINLAIHDHPKPSHYWHPDTVLKVSEGRSKRFGACADTGHWYRSDLVPVECVQKLKGRVISFHLKDLNTAKQDVPWGTGVCDIKGILTEVKRQGIKPVFSIEYERTSGAELVSNVEKCRDYFYQAAAEIAAGK